MTRLVVALLAFILLAVLLAAEAQQPGKVYRVGYVASGPPGCPPTTPSRAFRHGLLDAGYVEGRDVILDRRCIPRPSA